MEINIFAIFWAKIRRHETDILVWNWSSHFYGKMGPSTPGENIQTHGNSKRKSQVNTQTSTATVNLITTVFHTSCWTDCQSRSWNTLTVTSTTKDELENPMVLQLLMIIGEIFSKSSNNPHSQEQKNEEKDLRWVWSSWRVNTSFTSRDSEEMKSGPWSTTIFSAANVCALATVEFSSSCTRCNPILLRSFKPSKISMRVHRKWRSRISFRSSSIPILKQTSNRNKILICHMTRL